MRRTVSALLIALCAAPMFLAAQDSTFAVRTFPLRQLTSQDAAQLISAYVMAGGGTVFSAGKSIAAITVTTTPARMATVDSLLRAYDRAPQTAVLRFQVIATDATAAGTPVAGELATALRELIPSPSYRVVAEGVALAGTGRDFQLVAAGPEARFEISGSVGGISYGTPAMVDLRVTMRTVPEMSVDSASLEKTLARNFLAESTTLSTGLTTEVGRTVVIGSGAAALGSGQFILVLRPTLR